MPTTEGVQEQNLVMSAEIVPFLATLVVSTELNVEERDSVAIKLTEFEQRGIALAAELAAIKVTDRESYNLAAMKTLDAKDFIKEAAEFCEPFRLVTYGLYQKVLDRKKTILSPVEGSLLPVANNLKRFEREQEELRQRLQREAEQKQREEEEAKKVDAAIAAEAVGMSEQSVQTILEAPVTAPAPVVAPTFQRVKGLGHRENWCAEVFDLHALVKAVAKDKKLLPLLEANMPALNAQARSLKTAMALPGVRAVNKGV